ncbi:MAG: hypothetical protein WCC92_04050 [Candidatus Korobacteraceae bacterium]
MAPLDSITQVHRELADRLLRGFVGARSVTRAHPLDLLVAAVSRGSKLFSRGWGEEALLAELSTRVGYSDPSSPISVEWRTLRQRGRIARRDGTFVSPLELLPRSNTHRACARLAA